MTRRRRRSQARTTAPTSVSASDPTTGGSGGSSGSSDASDASDGTDDADASSGAETSTTSSTTATSFPDDTSTTAPPTTTTTTSGQPCNPDDIPDTVGFVYQKTIEIGVDTLQAGYYDNNRDVVTVFSFHGEGRKLDIDGNILETITAPPEALPSLDGAAYDTEADLGLLITQGCMLVEIDPETITTVSMNQLGHGMSVCAGLAIDDERNLYIASHGTNELVVLSRDTQTVLHRVVIAGYTCFDGIAEIAGSDNFLINDTTLRHSQIIDPSGTTVVASAPVGMPPLEGGGPFDQPDSMLTICRNGHTWVCEAYGTVCLDYAPADGDKEACGCLIPK